jgi:hypothetical protein
MNDLARREGFMLWLAARKDNLHLFATIMFVGVLTADTHMAWTDSI